MQLSGLRPSLSHCSPVPRAVHTASILRQALNETQTTSSSGPGAQCESDREHSITSSLRASSEVKLQYSEAQTHIKVYLTAL